MRCVPCAAVLSRDALQHLTFRQIHGGEVQADTRVESAWLQRLTLQ